MGQQFELLREKPELKIPEGIERSMEMFHNHQGQTLTVHAQYLENQAVNSAAALEFMKQQYGADVPFMRPAELAGDRVAMVPVLKQAVDFVESHDDVRLDWVMLLQPTNPFRTNEDIRQTMRIAREGGCDSVISVIQVFDVHPILMKRIQQNRLLPFCVKEKEGTRRQDYTPPAYMRNGAIYLTRRDVLMEQNSIWGDIIRPYVMPPERSVGVDSELDLKLVEILMREKLGSQVTA